MWDGAYGWHGGWMGLWGILFWVVLVVAAVALVRFLNQPRGNSEPKSDRALEILRERYARGEVDEEEFRRKREELESDR